MLQQICIQNFAIIELLTLEIGPGLTVISGETGAGKSMLVDALQLALGGRSDGDPVRPGAESAEISACFYIAQLPEARNWLEERELREEDDNCVLRRVISRGGRSRAYINGRPSTLRELQILGGFLAGIHGQHAQLSLLQRPRQQALLDDFGALGEIARQVRETALRWRTLQGELRKIQDSESPKAQLQLLEHQLQDLRELAVDAEEIENLNAEHLRLASADEILQDCGEALRLCMEEEEGAAGGMLHRSLRLLQRSTERDSGLQESLELMQKAAAMLQESLQSLRHHMENVVHDPEQLSAVESRIAAIEKAAQRHRVRSVELPAEQLRLEEEYANLQTGTEQCERLMAEITALEERYREQAARLRMGRAQQAARLGHEVNQWLAKLNMEHCRFIVDLEEKKDPSPAPEGSESAVFLAITNPGHAPAPLEQIASGGELSRIGLALQVATLGHQSGICLLFDEVDSGVGSGAADSVGDLLYRLSTRGQVLCVTHLAQVAGRADTHWVAHKSTENEQTRASLQCLDNKKKRIEELARLLSGKDISTRARKHAEEILYRAQKNRPQNKELAATPGKL